MQFFEILNLYSLFLFLLVLSIIFCFINRRQSIFTLNIYIRFICLILILIFLYYSFFKNNYLYFNFFTLEVISFNSFLIFFKFLFIIFFIFFLFILPINDNYFNNWEYFIILLLLFLGIFTVIFSNNLFIIFLGFELIAIAIYILIFLSPISKKLVDSGVEYFVLSAVVNLFLLLGISFLFYYYPSLYLGDIQLILVSDIKVDVYVFCFFLLILLSFVFKVGVVPFYNWLPSVYEGFSLPLLFLLMVPVKIAYFLVLIKLLQGPFITLVFFLSPFFFILGFLSIIIGILGALFSNSFKNLFAFASILHSGILFLFLAFFSEDSICTILIYLFIYGFLILIIFIFCILVMQRIGLNISSDFDSLLLNNKYLSWWFFFNIFSFVGVPPLFGFMLKSPLIMLFVDHGFIWGGILVILLLASGGFYYLKIFRIQKFREDVVRVRFISKILFLHAWAIILLSYIQFLFLFFPNFFILIFQFTI